MGVAYKRDIDDLRESPALDVMHLLKRRGALLSYSDPYIPQLTLDGQEVYAVAPETVAAEADCVVIVTDHSAFDYAALLEQARLIVDTRNALKGFTSEKIVRL
jgi:UDP-N-acetyl-D-glucosamine dehydrogenase